MADFVAASDPTVKKEAPLGRQPPENFTTDLFPLKKSMLVNVSGNAVDVRPVSFQTVTPLASADQCSQE
jgi:hypothetical protein